MKSDYWFPWYPAIYRADTQHLTAEQDGIYRRLIDFYMESQRPLPANDAALARIAGVSLECWSDAKRILIAYYTQCEINGSHVLTHSMCEQVLAESSERMEKRSKAGQVAASKRWENKHKSKDTNRNAIDMRKNATQHNITYTELYEANASTSSVPEAEKTASGTTKTTPKPSPKIEFDFESGKFQHIHPSHLKAWREAYPAVEVNGELARAAAWLISNPKQRKSDYLKFINNWLVKTQDRGGTREPFAPYFRSNPAGRPVEDVGSRARNTGEEIIRKRTAAAMANGADQRERESAEPAHPAAYASLLKPEDVF
jgi:uncharacterized protein YdaU (DUF1376 family)